MSLDFGNAGYMNPPFMMWLALRAQPYVEKNPSFSEDEIIILAKQGDEEAFDHLIRKYQKKVFGLAYGFFSNREDALEIVQETFLRVFQRLNQFDGRRPFEAWVYRIAYNLCVDSYRKDKKNQNRLPELIEWHTASKDTPEDEMMAALSKRMLSQAIKTLSPRQRVIVIMHHLQGMKLTDISVTLGVTKGTVKTLHHRACKNLKKTVSKMISKEGMDEM